MPIAAGGGAAGSVTQLLQVQRSKEGQHHSSVYNRPYGKRPTLAAADVEGILKVKGFIWIDEFVNKLLQKHGVSQDEVRQVFANRPQFRFVEKGHHPDGRK